MQLSRHYATSFCMNYEMINLPYAYLEAKSMRSKRLQCIDPNETIYSTTPVSRTPFKSDFSLSRTKTLSPWIFLPFLSENGPLKSDTV